MQDLPDPLSGSSKLTMHRMDKTEECAISLKWHTVYCMLEHIEPVPGGSEKGWPPEQ